MKKITTYDTKLLKAEEVPKAEIAALLKVSEEEAERRHIGRVHALVSVWGNVDHDGDVMREGAFRESLEKWRQSGDPIPWVWSHSWGSLDAMVGWVPPESARETDRGLEVGALMDLDDPPSKKVYGLLKQRRIRQFSFAYDILDSKETEQETDRNLGGKVIEINKVDLFECGPCLLGSNSETQLLEVASRQLQAAKYGRAVSTSNRSKLADAQQLIQDVIDSDDGPDSDSRSAPVKTAEDASQGEKAEVELSITTEEPDELAEILELVGGL